MSVECGACLVSYEGVGETEDYSRRKAIASSDLKCYECCCAIKAGESYELASGITEDEAWSADTCLVCADIAEAFSCDGSRMHGSLWDDMEEVYPAINTGCYSRLKLPEAKAALQRAWIDWRGL